MKKLLFSVLFLASAAMGLSSCMNGDYDATPDANSGAANPLANENNNNGGGSVGTAAQGEIRCRVNGQSLKFTNAKFQTLSGTDLLISGAITGSSDVKTLNLYVDAYNQANTYTFSGTSATSPHGTYMVTPFGQSGTDYNTATGNPAGSGSVTVTSDDGNEIKGTFSFTAYSSSGEKVDVTNGSFDALKM